MINQEKLTTLTIQDPYYLNSTVMIARGQKYFNPKFNSIFYIKIINNENWV